MVDAFNNSEGNVATPANRQVDHIVPLCLGGPDCPCNMQYLTPNDHAIKTKKDAAACKIFNVKL